MAPFDFIDLLKMLLSGGVIGFFIGLTGVGGGVLVLPVLTKVFGLDETVAVGTGSLYNFITRVYAGIAHIKLKNVHWRTVFIFLIAAMPANIATALYVSRQGSQSSSSEGAETAAEAVNKAADVVAGTA